MFDLQFSNDQTRWSCQTDVVFSSLCEKTSFLLLFANIEPEKVFPNDCDHLVHVKQTKYTKNKQQKTTRTEDTPLCFSHRIFVIPKPTNSCKPTMSKLASLSGIAEHPSPAFANSKRTGCVLGWTANIQPTPYVYWLHCSLSGQESLLLWATQSTKHDQGKTFAIHRRDETINRIPNVQCYGFLRESTSACYLHCSVLTPTNATAYRHACVDYQSSRRSLPRSTPLVSSCKNSSFHDSQDCFCYARWVSFAEPVFCFLAAIGIKELLGEEQVAEKGKKIPKSEFARNMFSLCIAVAFKRNVAWNVEVYCFLTEFVLSAILNFGPRIILNNLQTLRNFSGRMRWHHAGKLQTNIQDKLVAYSVVGSGLSLFGIKQTSKIDKLLLEQIYSQHTQTVQNGFLSGFLVENENKPLRGIVASKPISIHGSVCVCAFYATFCSFYSIISSSTSPHSSFQLHPSQNQQNDTQGISITKAPKTYCSLYLTNYACDKSMAQNTISVLICGTTTCRRDLQQLLNFSDQTPKQVAKLNSSKKENSIRANHFTRVNSETSIERMVLTNCRINLPYLRDSMWLVCVSLCVDLESLYGSLERHYEGFVLTLLVENNQNHVKCTLHTDIQVGVQRLTESGQCNTVVFRITFDGRQLVGNSQKCLSLCKKMKHKHSVSLAATLFRDLSVKEFRSLVLLRVEIQAMAKNYKIQGMWVLNAFRIWRNLNLSCNSMYADQIILNNWALELFKIISVCVQLKVEPKSSGKKLMIKKEQVLVKLFYIISQFFLLRSNKYLYNIISISF